MADLPVDAVNGIAKITENLSKTAMVLLDKLDKVCGWVANHETPKRVAINGFVKDVDNTNLNPYDKALLKYNAKKIVREASNQDKVIRIAIQNLTASARPQDIDDDWLEAFMDKVGIVSNQEIQLMWSKILASECNNPGTVSKSLLFILERMDKNDAEAFRSLANISVHIGDSVDPIILAEQLKDYNKFGINFENLFQLETLGLIKSSFGIGNGGFNETFEGNSENTEVRYFDHSLRFSGDNRVVQLGGVIFTKDGRSLYNVVDLEEQNEFWEKIACPWFLSQHPEQEKKSV